MVVAVNGATQMSERASPLVNAAQRLVNRIEMLVAEVTKLRADNAALRTEVRHAVALLETAGTASRGAPRARRGPAAATASTSTAVRRRRRGRAPKGRATPTDVTSDVVRAVLVTLGESTASEIAAEITRARVHAGVTMKAGEAIGGRAVRFLAERAGATSHVGTDGQRRYRLG